MADDEKSPEHGALREPVHGPEEPAGTGGNKRQKEPPVMWPGAPRRARHWAGQPLGHLPGLYSRVVDRERPSSEPQHDGHVTDEVPHALEGVPLPAVVGNGSADVREGERRRRGEIGALGLLRSDGRERQAKA